MLDSRRYMW